MAFTRRSVAVRIWWIRFQVTERSDKRILTWHKKKKKKKKLDENKCRHRSKDWKEESSVSTSQMPAGYWINWTRLCVLVCECVRKRRKGKKRMNRERENKQETDVLLEVWVSVLIVGLQMFRSIVSGTLGTVWIISWTTTFCLM